MLVIAIVTYFTMILQIEVGRTCGCFTYESVCELAFGRKGFYGLVVFMGINSFGVCVAYICLIQLVLPPILHPILVAFVPSSDMKYITPEVMIFGLSTFLLLPLSLYRNIASLEKVSFPFLLYYSAFFRKTSCVYSKYPLLLTAKVALPFTVCQQHVRENCDLSEENSV